MYGANYLYLLFTFLKTKLILVFTILNSKSLMRRVGWVIH